ncbi:hypothetical protein OSB04_un000031 [Centaurea solstitialis]|uniref:Uncharacterized protein n=1 Tax=Centaurea solstitialis TaxID=347529 RepID=A0AA38VVW4_9ASTR|nr:hypothetical protein OSB04_un000031 [Centaurea solstitialis]
MVWTTIDVLSSRIMIGGENSPIPIATGAFKIHRGKRPLPRNHSIGRHPLLIQRILDLDLDVRPIEHGLVGVLLHGTSSDLGWNWLPFEERRKQRWWWFLRRIRKRHGGGPGSKPRHGERGSSIGDDAIGYNQNRASRFM